MLNTDFTFSRGQGDELCLVPCDTVLLALTQPAVDRGADVANFILGAGVQGFHPFYLDVVVQPTLPAQSVIRLDLMVLPTGLLILWSANVFTVIARALAVLLDSFSTDRDSIFCW